MDNDYRHHQDKMIRQLRRRKMWRHFSDLLLLLVIVLILAAAWMWP